MTEVVLIQVSFLTVGSKQKNNKHAEYHDIFIPFKGQIYLKQGSHVSFLFGTWTLVLFSHVWVKPRFLLLTLTWQTSLKFKVCMKTLNELRIFLTKFSYNLFTKTFLLLRISLLKRFIYRRVNTSKILRGATIPVTLTKNQVKTISVNFIKKKLPSSKAIYGLPTRKIKSQEKSCIQSISHVCWKKVLTCSICHRVDTYRLVKRLGFSFW